MAFLLILVFIIFIVSFVSFFICIFMDLELIGVIMLSLWILTPILFYILLAIHTKKYPKNSIDEYNGFRIKNSLSDITIYIFKENGYWTCKCQDSEVKIELKGYLFMKTAVSFSKEKVRKNADEKDYMNNNLRSY